MKQQDELDRFPNEVGALTVARVLGMSRQSVHKLVQKAIIQKDEHSRIDLFKAVPLYISYVRSGREAGERAAADYNEEKARLTRAQADTAELALLEKSGVVIPADEAVLAWEAMLTNCKNKLLAIPSKAAPMLAAETDTAIVLDLLEDYVRDALTELQAGESIRAIHPVGSEAAAEIND